MFYNGVSFSGVFIYSFISLPKLIVTGDRYKFVKKDRLYSHELFFNKGVHNKVEQR